MDMFNVIICGAGPAGSSLAYYLRMKNITPLLLDRARFPRPKPCAGAFAVSLQRLFDFPLTGVIERTYSGATFKKGGRRFQLNLKSPWMHVARRAVFDEFLLKKAVEAGAVFKAEEKVERIEGTRVITSTGMFEGKVIVGADGGGSVVRRCGDYRKRLTWARTISGDIKTPGLDQVIFDFSYANRGFAWIFPRGSEASVGIGTYPADSVTLDKAFQCFLRDYKLPAPDKIHRFAYPVFDSPERLYDRNTLLVGDAAALASPATGAGIYNGVCSAYLASQAIYRHLEEGRDLSYYQYLIRRRLHPSLFFAASLNNLFNLFNNPIWGLKIGSPILQRMATGSLHFIKRIN